MKRSGWTLHEMIISLSVMGGVIALSAHMATQQLQFFRGVGEQAALRTQVGHAGAVASAMFWGLSAAGGDIVVAQDSAFEAHMSLGSAVVCAANTGTVTIPAVTTARGHTLAAFVEPPEEGDRMLAFFDDTLGTAAWLAFRVVAAPASGGACTAFPGISSTWTLPLHEPVAVPAGTVLRFTRPVRLSLYRAADGRSYLGAKDWNGAAQRFNAIQPVAGPLLSYDTDPEKTGLLFVYRDRQGRVLEQPIDPSVIASIAVIARAEASRVLGPAGSTSDATYLDSLTYTVALRNAR